MAQTQAQYINRNLAELENYINYLVDFSKEYDNAVKDLCSKSNAEKITKSEETIKQEKEIKESYETAMNLYNDLRRIADKYRNRMNIDSDLQWFHSRLNSARLPIYERTTLKLKHSTQNGVPTGGAANILQGNISKSDLDIKKEEFEKEVKKWEDRIEKNIKYPRAGRIGGTIRMWNSPDAVGMINIASGKHLPLYTKDAIKIKNIFDKKLDKFRKGDLLSYRLYMADKISYQFEDFNYDLDDIKGYIFKNNSAVVKRIKNSEEFKNMLLKHKEKIMNNKSFSDRFESDYNLHNAFGSVDFLNIGLDKRGDLHLYMFDTYDFNKGENAKVEAGRRQMLKGNLKGFFSIHEIIIKKKDLKQYGL